MLAYILCILVGIPFEFHLRSALFVDCAIPPPICDPHPNDAHSRRRGRRRARPSPCGGVRVVSSPRPHRRLRRRMGDGRAAPPHARLPRPPAQAARGIGAGGATPRHPPPSGASAARGCGRRGFRRGGGAARGVFAEAGPPYPAGAARVKNERGNTGRRRSPPMPAWRGARAAFRAVQGGPALPASGGRGSRGAASTPSSAGSGLPGGATSSSSNLRAAGSIRFSSDPTPLL